MVKVPLTALSVQPITVVFASDHDDSLRFDVVVVAGVVVVVVVVVVVGFGIVVVDTDAAVVDVVGVALVVEPHAAANSASAATPSTVRIVSPLLVSTATIPASALLELRGVHDLLKFLKQTRSHLSATILYLSPIADRIKLAHVKHPGLKLSDVLVSLVRVSVAQPADD